MFGRSFEIYFGLVCRVLGNFISSLANSTVLKEIFCAF